MYEDAVWIKENFDHSWFDYVNAGFITDVHPSKAGFPHMWPAGQKWPAKPLEVALDLSTKKYKIYVKIRKKLTFL